MIYVPLERYINIAINGPFWVEVANPEHPFTAMLISRSRGTCLIFYFAKASYEYRVTQKVSDLGWIDLELGSSPGRWAGTMVTYCPSRMVEHVIPISTQPRSETFWVTL